MTMTRSKSATSPATVKIKAISTVSVGVPSGRGGDGDGDGGGGDGDGDGGGGLSRVRCGGSTLSMGAPSARESEAAVRDMSSVYARRASEALWKAMSEVTSWLAGSVVMVVSIGTTPRAMKMDSSAVRQNDGLKVARLPANVASKRTPTGPVIVSRGGSGTGGG